MKFKKSNEIHQNHYEIHENPKIQSMQSSDNEENTPEKGNKSPKSPFNVGLATSSARKGENTIAFKVL